MLDGSHGLGERNMETLLLGKSIEDRMGEERPMDHDETAVDAARNTTVGSSYDVAVVGDEHRMRTTVSVMMQVVHSCLMQPLAQLPPPTANTSNASQQIRDFKMNRSNPRKKFSVAFWSTIKL